MTTPRSASHRQFRAWFAGPATRHIAVTAALAVGGAVMLLPFYIMIRSAFTPEDYILDGSLSLSHLTLSNFSLAWNSAPWARYYINSLLQTGLIYLLQASTSVPAGYALARLRFRGRKLAFSLVLLCFIVPPQVTAIPNYVLLSRAGLDDTLAGLVIPFMGTAFGVYLVRQFALSIPASLFDAARLDGVGGVAMVWRVVLPNVRPALLALGILSVVYNWNDLFWPNIILRTSAHATVPYAISQFASQEAGSNYGAQMAAATFTVLPLIAGFLLCQRQFVRGLALTRGHD